MKLSTALAFAAIPFLLTACATPRPPTVYHNTDPSALVVQSFDERTGQMVSPAPTEKMESMAILAQAKNLPQHQTAVIILENYTEPEPGVLFRDRSIGWFMGLRGLG